MWMVLHLYGSMKDTAGILEPFGQSIKFIMEMEENETPPFLDVCHKKTIWNLGAWILQKEDSHDPIHDSSNHYSAQERSGHFGAPSDDSGR